MPATNEPRQREVRVFISSTFRDMQEEREELVKQIFPQLRRLCESRGVTWGEVDLRWGVPDEAKAEGKVLPLCLAEIERCRPYFIGLLGERYGWVPEEIPDELLEAQPWLTKYRKESVTALEILHGALLNRDMDGHAFFYFRDPAYAVFHDGFTEEDPTRRDRLAALKEDIRKSGFPVAENFGTPRELGEWVLRDITAVIESLYPESSVPDPLDRAAADHEAYAASRRRVYIGRPEYIERLDAHAAGDGPPLVVLGESGGGKTALLANWTRRWSAQHPETPVIVHFIGAAPDSANWVAMLRRLMGELQRSTAPAQGNPNWSLGSWLRRMFARPTNVTLRFEIPDKPDALRRAFASALNMVAARGRVVLVLDALNQIEDRDGALDLTWLPPVIPSNVRLVVSTLSGRAFDAVRQRGWDLIGVEPLQPDERERLIVDYLKQFAKELSEARRRRMATAPQSANGLFLTTLLNELRLFGSHEELDQRISWYLEAPGPVELYKKLIERWEKDYGQPHPTCPDVVRESLGRVWAARRGLSETELLETLGTPGSPLPRAVWSPLFLAAGDALVNRGGLLTFAHNFLREAVRVLYLPLGGHQQRVHRVLAEYFGTQPRGPRQLDELPWQWQEAGEWQALADLLAEPTFLGALWRNSEFEVKAYWTRVEAQSPLRMEQAYAAVLQEPVRHADYAWRIGTLLADTGKPEAALRVRAGMSKYYRDKSDRRELTLALNNEAITRRACGDLDGALALFKESERLCRHIGHKERLATSLGNHALILSDRGDLDGAMALHKEEEQLCRQLGNKESLQVSLNNQAVIFQARGDLDSALNLFKETESLCRQLGNTERLATYLGNQALILSDRGDLDGAMALHKDEEQLCRQIGDKTGLQASLGNQAIILQKRGDLNGAMVLHNEEVRLCRELGDKDALQGALGNQAVILSDRGDLDSAMALHKEKERLCRELDNKAGLAGSLNNQALILRSRGDLDAAMALHKEGERLYRELGDKDGLQRALGNQGAILGDRGDLEGAIALFKEKERLCRELGNMHGVASSLGNQAVTLALRGNRDGAMALHKEQERLCRELGDPKGLAISLAGQASLIGRANRPEARRLADEALAIATRHGYQTLVWRLQNLRDSLERGGVA